MIAVEVGRLEDRADGRRGMLRPMNRESLLRYAGSATLLDVIVSEYRNHLDRILCVVIDEEEIVHGGRLRSILLHTLPEEVERIEFLAAPPILSRRHRTQFMLRIYTRRFIQEMAALDLELRTPSFGAGGSFCR